MRLYALFVVFTVIGAAAHDAGDTVDGGRCGRCGAAGDEVGVVAAVCRSSLLSRLPSLLEWEWAFLSSVTSSVLGGCCHGGQRMRGRGSGGTYLGNAPCSSWIPVVHCRRGGRVLPVLWSAKYSPLGPGVASGK